MQDPDVVEEILVEDPEGYDLHSPYYIKVWVLIAFVCTLLALIASAIALGAPGWIRFTPPPGSTSTAIPYLQRVEGIFHLCYAVTANDATNNCTERDISGMFAGTGVQFSNYQEIISFRQAHLSTYVIGYAVLIIGVLAMIILLVEWIGTNYESEYFRKFRLAIGIILYIAALFYQISMILYHATQLREKTRPTQLLVNAFAQWPEALRSTTKIEYFYCYGLAWLTTILIWIASWIMMFSYCCWSYGYEEEEEAPGPLSHIPEERSITYAEPAAIRTPSDSVMDAFDVLSGRLSATSSLTQRRLTPVS